MTVFFLWLLCVVAISPGCTWRTSEPTPPNTGFCHRSHVGTESNSCQPRHVQFPPLGTSSQHIAGALPRQVLQTLLIMYRCSNRVLAEPEEPENLAAEQRGVRFLFPFFFNFETIELNGKQFIKTHLCHFLALVSGLDVCFDIKTYIQL